MRLLPKAISSNLCRLRRPPTDFPRSGFPFTIEKLAEGLQTPRVIVVAPDGTIYVSSRDAGTISMLRPGTGSTARTVLTKPNVHGMAIQAGRLFFITIREIFSAPIKADGLPAVYAEADIFAFPTLDDPFGIVVLEAAASGAPHRGLAVRRRHARPRRGRPERVRRVARRAGRVGRAIVTLASDPALRRRLGDRGHATTLDRTPERAAAGYEQAVRRRCALPAVCGAGGERRPLLGRAPRSRVKTAAKPAPAAIPAGPAVRGPPRAPTTRQPPAAPSPRLGPETRRSRRPGALGAAAALGRRLAARIRGEQDLERLIALGLSVGDEVNPGFAWLI